MFKQKFRSSDKIVERFSETKLQNASLLRLLWVQRYAFHVNPFKSKKSYVSIESLPYFSLLQCHRINTINLY